MNIDIAIAHPIFRMGVLGSILLGQSSVGIRSLDDSDFIVVQEGRCNCEDSPLGRWDSLEEWQEVLICLHGDFVVMHEVRYFMKRHMFVCDL